MEFSDIISEYGTERSRDVWLPTLYFSKPSRDTYSIWEGAVGTGGEYV